VLVKLVDDLGGSVLRSTDAVKAARLVADTKPPTVGKSGSASKRVAVVIARAPASRERARMLNRTRREF
jgi:hypothetical protein